MSFEHRRPTIPFSDAPRATCRWCGEAIVYAAGAKRGQPDRRRRWHPLCVEIYNATDPREARAIVRKRDRGICSACGLDTNRLRRQVKGRGRTQKLRALGFRIRGSLWELDHIVPLIDGGGHELSNLQTLCTPCHKQKTAAEARARAARRAGRATEPSVPSDRLAGELDRLLEAADDANRRAEVVLSQLRPGGP